MSRFEFRAILTCSLQGRYQVELQQRMAGATDRDRDWAYRLNFSDVSQDYETAVDVAKDIIDNAMKADEFEEVVITQEEVRRERR